MIKDCFGNVLNYGDVIVISMTNTQWPGIFLGEGSSGNIQYKSLNEVSFLRSNLSREFGYKMYKDYINRGSSAVCRVSPSSLSPEMYTFYTGILNNLLITRNQKKLKKLDNFYWEEYRRRTLLPFK